VILIRLLALVVLLIGGPAQAAISFISQAAAEATSVTLGTHQAGDLILGFASRDGNTTPPTVPGGWTTISSTGDANMSSSLAYKVAASGSETSGTWTNASALTIHVYRGQHASDPIGDDSATADAGGSSVDYPALTLEVSDGTSWVVLFAGHAFGSDATLNAPSGHTNRSNSLGNAHIVGGHDSNGGVASWAGGNGTMTGGGFDDYMARAVEIKAASTVTIALTGTATASITESDIVTGGKTVILTITDDTWVPAAGLGPSPTVRGVGAFGSGTTSFTAAVPTAGNAPQTGDAMYIIMESTDSTTGAGTPNTPGGWSKLFENTIAAGSSSEPAVSTLTIFGKIAGASESNVTVDGVGNHCAGAMIVIAGHGLAAITDTVVGSATDHGTSAANLLAPSISVTAGSLVIVAMGLGDDANDTTNVSGVTNANLASITERIDQTVSTGSGGGVGFYTATVAGTSTGTTEWDHDTAASSQSLQLGIPPPATTPFADARAAIRDGLDSAQSEGGGWDAKVKPNIPLGNIVRTSDTVVTITLQAQADYNITAQETITATVPDSALTGAGPIVATPTFTIDTGGGGAPAVPQRMLMGVGT
jgi:hypothetical protein